MDTEPLRAGPDPYPPDGRGPHVPVERRGAPPRPAGYPKAAAQPVEQVGHPHPQGMGGRRGPHRQRRTLGRGALLGGERHLRGRSESRAQVTQSSEGSSDPGNARRIGHSLREHCVQGRGDCLRAEEKNSGAAAKAARWNIIGNLL